jgi:hypothetical protein
MSHHNTAYVEAERVSNKMIIPGKKKLLITLRVSGFYQELMGQHLIKRLAKLTADTPALVARHQQ